MSPGLLNSPSPAPNPPHLSKKVQGGSVVDVDVEVDVSIVDVVLAVVVGRIVVDVVVAVVGWVVAEVVVAMVGVVVVVSGQLESPSEAEQASQQLAQLPAVPCFAAQCAASFLTLQTAPSPRVMQHVTAFGLPQVECAAHFFTNRIQ